MDIKPLNPDQIITLTDYPVHSAQVLKIYFKIYQQGAGGMMPPTPVISIDKVKSRIRNKRFAEFLNGHPEVEYFLLDGSHKTTAATLTHQPIQGMIFSTDGDIQEALKMVEKGDLFSLTTPSTIGECVEDLRKHFWPPAGFETILEKTDRMVQDGILPKYMIDFYSNHRGL